MIGLSGELCRRPGPDETFLTSDETILRFWRITDETAHGYQLHNDERRTAEKFLLVEYDIPRGCIASYYPETNALVPLQSFAIGARTPTSKSIPVVLTLRPLDSPLANARDVADAAVA